MWHKSATSWQAILESLQIAGAGKKQTSSTHCLKAVPATRAEEPTGQPTDLLIVLTYGYFLRLLSLLEGAK